MVHLKQKPLVITASEIWRMRKPKYDGYAIGHGAHKDKRYKRLSSHDLREQLRREWYS